MMNSLTTVLFVLTVLCSGATAWQVGNYGVINGTEKPSIFRGRDFQLEDGGLLPEIPTTQGPLELPKVPEIPKIPGIPEIPKIPGVPEVPKIPGLPELPKLPEIPKIPGLPELPKLPEIPKIPGLPSISDLIPQRICLVVRCYPILGRIQICRCIKSRK